MQFFKNSAAFGLVFPRARWAQIRFYISDQKLLQEVSVYTDFKPFLSFCRRSYKNLTAGLYFWKGSLDPRTYDDKFDADSIDYGDDGGGGDQ